MATEDGIIKCFMLLRQAGCRSNGNVDTPDDLAATAQVWALVLPDVDDEHLERLTLGWLRSAGAQWWPLPGQLLELYRRGVARAEDDGDTAWGLLIEALGRHGRYNPPTREGRATSKHDWWLHPDPRTCAAMDAGLAALGGWWDACSTEPGDAAARASFRAAYTAALRAHDAGPQRAALGVANRPALTDGGGR